MFFQESDSIASEDPDLSPVLEQVDQQLRDISSSAPLRPADIASFLGVDENQVESAFDLLAAKGVLRSEKMVECEACQNLMSASSFYQAADDEDVFNCSQCGRIFPGNSESILVYRMTDHTLSRTKAQTRVRNTTASTTSEILMVDEPLADRAQIVLIAMMELGAVDSDSRKSTEQITLKALGPGSDPNAVKGVMADLKIRQLVQSKTGRTGGCWLSEKGQMRAKKLRSSSQNSATV